MLSAQALLFTMTTSVDTHTIAPEEYDLVVIGSGEGSKFLAWTLARQGQRVAMIERKWIGGSCPNIACLPSKNLIHSAKVASYFSRAAEFGINTSDYRLFKIPMAADLHTRTLSETRGFMKALVAADDSILGFTVFGVEGGEIMGAVQIAMLGKLPYTALRDAILTHPTLIEGLVILFMSASTSVEAH